MADSTRNVFDVLEDDHDESAPLNECLSRPSDFGVGGVSQPSGSLSAETSDTAANESAEAQAWTDVSRARRLVPKYSLSKEVMGLESTRIRSSAPPTPSTPAGSVDLKKKGILNVVLLLFQYAIMSALSCQSFAFLERKF